MIQLLTTLNWVLGIMFFLVAIFFPIIDQSILEKSSRIAAESTVSSLLNIEKSHFENRKTFLYFAPGKMPDTIRSELGLAKTHDPDFVYEAYASNDGEGLRLNIHAHASDKAIKTGRLPAITHTLTWDTKAITRQWDLPKENYGLFAGLF